MENESIKQFRLGLLLVSATILLVSALYLVGRNHSLFGKTVTLVTYFTNVNGLQPGNIVRFAGSDAGTVETVEVINDTAVRVMIVVQEASASHIRQNAVAAIGTDGLMGNKLINITNLSGSTAKNVINGSCISTLKPVETDEMLRTLDQTNKYVEGIAYNLKNATDKISDSRGTLWKLLTDTSLAGDADAIFANLNQSSRNIEKLSVNLNSMATRINEGDGLLGTLLTDTLLPAQLHRTGLYLQSAGQQSAAATADLHRFTQDIEQGKGTLGMLLRDSSVSSDLRTTITTFKQSTEKLQQTLEAIQNIPLIKKSLEQEKKKAAK